MTTPVHGYSWRDGLDQLEQLVHEQTKPGRAGMILASEVREIVEAVRRYEDDTDESIRSALWEDAVVNGEYDEECEGG